MLTRRRPEFDEVLEYVLRLEAVGMDKRRSQFLPADAAHAPAAHPILALTVELANRVADEHTDKRKSKDVSPFMPIFSSAPHP